MDNYAIESFIDFCDEMTIAEEGFLSTIKLKFKKTLLTLVKAIEKLINKCKDSKLKRAILKLLQKAKKALGDVDSIKSDDDVQEMKETIEEVQEEVEFIKDELEGIHEREEAETSENMNGIIRIEKNRGIARYVELKNIPEDTFYSLENDVKTMKSSETFQEYKKALSHLKQVMKIPDNCTLEITRGPFQWDSATNTGKFYVYYTQDAKPLNNRNYKLIHASTATNLTALNPTWRSKDGFYYTSPRVYFAMVPVDRTGRKYEPKEDGKIRESYGNEIHKYTPTINFSKVFADTTLSNFRKVGAVYIETESQIPVTEI